MELSVFSSFSPAEEARWRDFLAAEGLFPAAVPAMVFSLFEGKDLVATLSLSGDLLLYFAVRKDHRGEDLIAPLLTAAKKEAFSNGVRRLYLVTKPENRRLFSGLLFSPVAESKTALLMESPGGGLSELLEKAPPPNGAVGAAILNADPFTLGHRALVEKAAALCDTLYLFVLSEEQSRFSAADRLEMVRRGVADLPGVFVLPTGRYLVSAATFPSYFLKNRADAPKAAAELDIAVFCQKIAPALGITRRFLGSEPADRTTAAYNTALLEALPKAGVSVTVFERETKNGVPISAKTVRALLDEGNFAAAAALLPESTVNYLKTRSLFD